MIDILIRKFSFPAIWGCRIYVAWWYHERKLLRAKERRKIAPQLFSCWDSFRKYMSSCVFCMSMILQRTYIWLEVTRHRTNYLHWCYRMFAWSVKRWQVNLFSVAVFLWSVDKNLFSQIFLNILCVKIKSPPVSWHTKPAVSDIHIENVCDQCVQENIRTYNAGSSSELKKCTQKWASLF